MKKVVRVCVGRIFTTYFNTGNMLNVIQFFDHFGRYILFLKAVLSKPEKWKFFRIQVVQEALSIGIGSFVVVALISFFAGAVSTIQIAYQLVTGLVPEYVIGRIVRDSNILEFSPTITCLVLAGKVGSNIASEIGTMKVSEQIDALEVMGINSANFVTLSKIAASLITIPLLVVYAMCFSLMGGAISGMLSGLISVEYFVKGLRSDFELYSVIFCLVKAFTFSFIISSVSSYQGYRTEDGALEVGESSTKAVVYSCMAIVFFDYIISQLMLFK